MLALDLLYIRPRPIIGEGGPCMCIHMHTPGKGAGGYGTKRRDVNMLLLYMLLAKELGLTKQLAPL